MANTMIDELRTDIMLGLKEVSNEATGFIQSVNTSTGAETAAIGDDIKIPVGTAGEIIDTPVGFNFPTEGNSDAGALHMQITDCKTVTIDWNGENEKAMMNSGVLGTVLAQQFADAFRKIRNLIEKAAYEEACKGASRAYGTIGTVPFGVKDDMSDLANLQGILDENGTPESNRTVVLSPSAKINLLSKQMNMIKVNESGSPETLRTGIIMPTYGFNVRTSAAGSKAAPAAVASGYAVNGEAVKEGDKEIPIDTGSGAIAAGNIVTFADDANKYVAGAGSTATKLVLNPKGVLQAEGDNKAITVTGGYKASVAMHKNAMALAIRPPAVPKRGDMALAREYVTDPLTNITYEVAVYGGQRCNQIQISVAYGVKTINGEHMALLIG